MTQKMVAREATKKLRQNLILKFLNKATVVKKINNWVIAQALRRPQLKNRKRSSTPKRRGRTSSGPTKLSSRQRCAGTGNFTRSVNSWTNAHLRTGSMNCTRKCTCPQIIRPKFATSSTRRCTVPMEIDASFCTPSTTLQIRIRNSTIPRFF